MVAEPAQSEKDQQGCENVTDEGGPAVQRIGNARGSGELEDPLECQQQQLHAGDIGCEPRHACARHKAQGAKLARNGAPESQDLLIITTQTAPAARTLTPDGPRRAASSRKEKPRT